MLTAIEEEIIPQEANEDTEWKVTHTYSVFHPIKGTNPFILESFWPQGYTWVAYVYANSLGDAVLHAQNDYSPQYAQQGERDTDVGDVISKDGEFFMVMPEGFKLLKNE